MNTTALRSYSQLLEDCYVHQNLINISRADISLVEIGCFDGKTYSNTLMLEEVLQTPPSFLVEASPKSAALARKNRPSSTVLELAVSSDFGVTEFAGDAAVSGMTEKLTNNYKERWNINSFAKYKVLTSPMWAVQELMDRPYIDFLSIDVQGAERSILETTDWGQPIGSICIELEGHKKEDDSECKRILLDNGFEFRERLMISEIWVNTTYARNKVLFDRSKAIDFSQYIISPYCQKHIARLMHAFC